MKYKIIHTCKKPSARMAHKARKKRARIELNYSALPVAIGTFLPNESGKRYSPADISDLFGFGGFYDPYSETVGESSAKNALRGRKTALMRAFIWRLRMALERQKETFVSKMAVARERRAARRRRTASLSILSGALCAVLCVFALSAAVVSYRMLLKDRVLRFETVEIPELVGQSFNDTSLDTDLFEVALNYMYDSNTEEGTIIEQTPSAGVIRRVYRGGEPCKVTLTVSLGERIFVMRDYTSQSARDVLLELKTESVKFKISEKYSDTVKAGQVISTTPAPGESFTSDEVVTITLSLGKERKFAAIPDLSGLTEVRARETLRALGFEVGQIKYVASQNAIGTVISQTPSAYSLLEIGERVDLEVSAGMSFSQKSVPDLYGMTVEEAREALADVGLVCGTVYSVQSSAGRATVVSQSIPAGTPITSGVVSVDIYISS